MDFENKGETVVTTDNSETIASTTSAPAPNEQRPSGDTKRRRRAPRRNLSEEQKREITHLYSETSTPLPEIRQRFGIGDSSLYRLIQQYGGKLRGRTPRAGASKAAAASQKPARRSSAPARPARGRRARVVVATVRRSAPSVAESSSKITFRVSFVGTRIVSASTMRDAVRQSEAFGATEITEVVRLD
jgi:transposase-like protein